MPHIEEDILKRLNVKMPFELLFFLARSSDCHVRPVVTQNRKPTMMIIPSLSMFVGYVTNIILKNIKKPEQTTNI
jgi:hypothetical protein